MGTNDGWITKGYEDLELSTQLVARESLARGYEVEVLDREANFLRVIGKGQVQYFRQATRTAADSYMAPLIMENKKVTKTLLAEAGIRVPDGRDYSCIGAMLADWPRWSAEGAVVIKPNATNFGIAVSILSAPFARVDFERAGKAAFDEGSTVLVEEFLPGREYRFLVIDGITRAVLRRVPANVTGDGTSTIAALVEEKNRDARRGSGYLSPLEKLRRGEEEEATLRGQGLGFDSVLEAGKTAFLRKNSNISTGGDSIDLTDSVHAQYKDIAAASAEAVGARICGVDMMIVDIGSEATDSNYGIIELNFNPALHIHDFPYSGENRAVEKYVLDLVGL